MSRGFSRRTFFGGFLAGAWACLAGWAAVPAPAWPTPPATPAPPLPRAVAYVYDAEGRLCAIQEVEMVWRVQGPATQAVIYDPPGDG
jgi:hypothetical protein